MSRTRLNSPPEISGNSLFGSLFQMKKEGVSFYTRTAKENGDAVVARIGWKKFYIFFHPDHIREVLQEKSDIYIKGDQYNQLRHLMGTGLLTSEGKDWEKQRRLLNPIFGKSGLDILLGHIKKSSASFVHKLPVNQEIDWSRKMFDYALDVAVTSFFGSNLDYSKLDQMAIDTHNCMRFVSKRMTVLINLPLFIPTQEHRKFQQSLKNIKNEIERIYDVKSKNPSEHSKDLLDLLISAQDEDQLKLSKEEVFDQVMSFLMAGHETTALSMSWLFHLLAKNPIYQDKIIAELEGNNYVFDSSNDLNRYPFLSAVISETMRLYPAGWVIARNSVKDDSVGEWSVKKNKVVAVCPFVSHRDPRWWERPEEFYPERFLDEEKIKNLPRGTYVPFSIGKRNCIGARFSLLEIMILCIDFFKHHRISTNQSYVGVKGFVTLKTDRPVHATVHRR